VLLEETEVAGVFVIAPEPIIDERGMFARVFCRDELRARKLCSEYAQCSVSYNHRTGTLRGLHFQEAPHAEVKIVRCTRGAILDVVLDLRRGSPTYLRSIARELTAANHLMLYIPEGCAHGFQTLVDESEVFYQISTPYVPESARGVRWDDPAFGIAWPAANRTISKRDASYPDYVP
jgi:dTDP-4-dehydrorhamnose 3,5-epimerase